MTLCPLRSRPSPPYPARALLRRAARLAGAAFCAFGIGCVAPTRPPARSGDGPIAAAEADPGASDRAPVAEPPARAEGARAAGEDDSPAEPDWALPVVVTGTEADGADSSLRARGPRDMVPPGRPAPARISGAIDREQIREVIRGHIGELTGCYDSAGSGFEGLVSVEFDIGEDGRVARARVRGTSEADEALASCIESVLLSMVFPSPGPGSIITISYPFRFERAAASP